MESRESPSGTLSQRCGEALEARESPTGAQLGTQIRVAYPRARVDPYLDLFKPSQKLG